MNIWTKLAMFSFFETDRFYFPNAGKSGRKSICTGQLLYEVPFGSVGNL